MRLEIVSVLNKGWFFPDLYFLSYLRFLSTLLFVLFILQIALIPLQFAYITFCFSPTQYKAFLTLQFVLSILQDFFLYYLLSSF